MKIWVAVLSLIGGIAGIISGFLVTAGGTIFGEEQMANDGAAVFWISFLAIALGFVSWIPKKWVQRLCGLALLVISIYGFFVNGLFFTFAFIFLAIAGVMAFFMKPKKQRISNHDASIQQ